ncbi:diguanylate cyclase [Bacillus inaquosorum]|uniref:diguanylate cyclase n=1 Tax=Bacillus inaquosorum TaxID=483913 RepID=UPI003CFEBCFD
MVRNIGWLKEDQLKDLILDLGEKKIIMFIIDIDNSKDIFGKSIDLDVLNNILSALKKTFGQEQSFFCKIGRDAFACLLICDANFSLFTIMQQKIDFQNQLKMILNKEITVCMGVSVYPDMCKKREELLSFAYDALFSAKLKGPNNIEVSTSENMKLKSVYFRTTQLEKLSYYSNKNNYSESEVIRKALDEYLNKKLYNS